jgi:hypothetical protein
VESIIYNLFKNVKEKGLFIYNYKLEEGLSDVWDAVK